MKTDSNQFHGRLFATALLLLISAVDPKSQTAPSQPASGAPPSGTNAATPHAFAIVLSDTKTPVITENDLVEYDFTRHRMRVRAEALAKIPRFSASGRSFEVVVDGAPIYSGRFVSSLSSMSFNEPVILVDFPTISLTIDRDYHAPSEKLGPDPRSDERLRQALAKSRKLTSPSRSGVDGELIKRTAQILTEQMRIKAGMTRAEPLKNYTTEGGLSTARQRTFAHRDCPYIKVDVEFSLSSPDQAGEHALDTIAKISKPYLDWAVAD